MKPPKVTKKLAVSNFKTRITVVITWILILLGVYAIYFTVNMFPVIAGFGAKALCSCVYVQGRAEEDVKRQELGTMLGSFGSFSINREDSSATGKVWFLSSKKAIYRKGLGCTLVNDLEEEELRAQKFVGKTTVAVNQDTIAWPDGNLIADSLPSGIDKAALDKIVDGAFAEANPEGAIKTRSIVVVYDGAIVAEKYADGFSATTPQMGWSMAKSITNAMIGILVKQGKISVNAPAPVEAWANDDRKKITTNDLLRASSGLDWSEIYSRPSDAVEMLFRSGDAALYAYSKKRDKDPNVKFYYSSGSTNILSWIVRNQVGESSYHQFPYEKLFNKIGMHSALLELDPSGTFVGSSFGYATARDWARFGLLYLNDGIWNGERILPEGWVQYATTPAPAAPKGEYGALWWLNAGEKGKPSNRLYPDVPTDAFVADGFEGQYIFVVPSKKLVVVRLGLSQKRLPDMNKLVAGIIETLPK
jgi:CubicO group peptidase (beta-lactamase class C family)